MIYTVTTYTVDVLGYIWWPNNVLCSMRYTLPSDIEPTREAVADWLTSHSGDFSEVVDFQASIADAEIPFESEENEYDYLDTLPSDY